MESDNKKMAAFIDRDGVITEINSYKTGEGVEFLTRKEDIRIIPGAVEGIRKLNEGGVMTILVTNQPQVGRGLITEGEVVAINEEIKRMFREQGAIIDDVYFCPHHPTKGIGDYGIECECRKPKPGMILSAARKYGINLEESYMIGDRISDIRAGDLAGTKTIGVRTGYGCDDGFTDAVPQAMVDDLLGAARMITSKKKDKIQLLISTGGKGKRMGHLTEDIPKPMLEVNGKPLLHHLVDWAKKNDIEEIIMLNGYKADKIIDYFGNGEKFGVKIIHSNEPYPLGSGGPIRYARHLIKGPFAYISGDLVCDVDLGKMMDFHKNNNSDMTVFLHESSHPEDSDLLKVDYDWRITRFISKHEMYTEDFGKLGNAGLSILEPKILDLMDQVNFNYENYLYPKILENNLKMMGYVSDELIRDMGTPERLKGAEGILVNNSGKEKKRIFITGAGGMMGAHILDFLIEKGHDVLGIDFVPTTDIRELNNKAVYRECDIRDRNKLTSMLNYFKPDLIFHLAAQSYPTVSWDKPEYTIEANIMGTVNLFEAVKELKLDCTILNAGSSAIYGYTEQHEVPIKESKELKPLHPYGVSKVAQEMLGYQYYKNFGIKSVCIRIFNTTGPKKVGDVCSDFTRQIVLMEKGLQEKKFRVGNLDKQRAITDVRDLIESFWLAVNECECEGESYNVSGEKVYLIRDIVEMLRGMTEVNFEVVQDEKLIRSTDEPIIYGDSTRFKEKTGWKQKIELKKTLKDMIDYWRQKL